MGIGFYDRMWEENQKLEKENKELKNILKEAEDYFKSLMNKAEFRDYLNFNHIPLEFAITLATTAYEAGVMSVPNNTNLITKSSMSVECAITESQLGNYCIADRNKNQRAGLADEPPEVQELINSSAKFLAELIAKGEE